MAYDYMDAVSTGIKDYILESVEPGSMTEEKLFQYLSDETAMNKGVLVFDYGGYVYANEAHAKECLIGNTNLLEETLEFFNSDELNQCIQNKNYLVLDVVIRQYLFMDAFDVAADLICRTHPNFFKETNNKE